MATAGLATIDWVILLAYLGAMIGLSVWVGRGQASQDDYYVGGRKLPWWAIGISTMATQTSVISFISIPAFVALKPGGGLTWLQYELAVPLAMIFVMVVLLPRFRALQLISVYEYLELRFSMRVRRAVSAVFLVSRGLGTAVGVYASALVLSVVTGVRWEVLVLVVGGVTIVYDTIGGMSAVVWSDVVQMAVLLVGLGLCVILAVDRAGGLGQVLSSLPAERVRALDMRVGVHGEEVPFWAYLVGGFFLYASYYGTDQSQTQRALSSPSAADTRRSLVLNGLARFPLTAAYLLLGVALAAAVAHHAPLRERMLGVPIDRLVPTFVVTELPVGVRGILVAAMLAAAMSSLDSALNSMSAATMRDFLTRARPPTDRQLLWMGRGTTIAWGVVVTALALVAEDLAASIIEAINKVGSAFYGPILGVFVAGVLCRRATSTSVLVGLVLGVGVNLVLWLGAPQVHWMWWNATGFAMTTLCAWGLGRAAAGVAAPEGTMLDARQLLHDERPWFATHAVLVAAFLFILGVGGVLTWVAR